MVTAVKKKSTKKTKTTQKPLQTRSKKRMIQVNILDIEKKAFELYEQRGSSHGSDLTDWLEAERILAEQK